jgi:peroxiredoxin
MLNALAQNLGHERIRVILVSADEPEDRPKAVAFLKSAEIALPSYLAARPLGPFKVGLNPRWPGMVPATFLFDAAGKLRYFWGGPVYEHEALKVVTEFLENRLVDGEADFTVAPGKVER